MGSHESRDLATRAMSRFPFIATINLSSPSVGREGNATYLRNTILQSASSVRFSGWNKQNFRRALGSRDASKYCVAVVTVSIAEDGVPCVYLESGERYSLPSLVSDLRQRGYPMTLLFVYCDAGVSGSILECIREQQEPSIVAIITPTDTRLFLFALACETTTWWGLCSSRHDEITYHHLAECVIAVIENYRSICERTEFSAQICWSPGSLYRAAWVGGANYARTADIDKLRREARWEQISDTIKRIFDCAQHPRLEHLPTNERLVSSQGLFWLSELANENDVLDWVRNTRFFSDVAPSKYEHDAAPLRVRLVDRVSQEALAELRSLFVEVPSAKYLFGGTDEAIESEPPAPLLHAKLDSFMITRCPITVGLWRAFVAQPAPGSDTSAWMPVTNVSFFEAEAFAHAASDAFREHFMDFSAQRIALPTEYQWEAAARGTSAGNYPWGDEFEDSRCNYGMRVGQPTPVGTYSPRGDSPLGCQDMAGNVREWTRSYGGTRGVDWSSHTLQGMSLEPRVNPSSRMVIRGGSYSYDSQCVQTWVRNTQIASRRDGQTGFRLVWETRNE